MELLVEGLWEECYEVVSSCGDVVGTVSQRFLLVHVRLVTEHCTAEAWTVEWVWWVFTFECTWFKASECIEMA